MPADELSVGICTLGIFRITHHADEPLLPALRQSFYVSNIYLKSLLVLSGILNSSLKQLNSCLETWAHVVNAGGIVCKTKAHVCETNAHVVHADANVCKTNAHVMHAKALVYKTKGNVVYAKANVCKTKAHVVHARAIVCKTIGDVLKEIGHSFKEIKHSLKDSLQEMAISCKENSNSLKENGLSCKGIRRSFKTGANVCRTWSLNRVMFAQEINSDTPPGKSS